MSSLISSSPPRRGPPRPTGDLEAVALRIWRGAEGADFRGHDPYDGLHAPALTPLLARSRLLRLAVIQGVKRSPLNLRPVLGVKPGLNPKGLALFMRGAADLPALSPAHEICQRLADMLVCLASQPDGAPAFGDRAIRNHAADEFATGKLTIPGPIGWGYHFPWQAVAFQQPPYFPTVVATSFVVDAFAAAGHPAARRITEAAAFLVTECLHRHRDHTGVCFSYSPRDETRVYNASLFAAKILARAAALGGSSAAAHAELASEAAAWVAARQQPDGSWLYGEASHWHWIDNLHTGFVLETLDFVGQALGTDIWSSVIESGLSWYRTVMFEDDATARYYPERRYPLDPHSFAQAALTFLALDRRDPENRTFARRILERAMECLWNADRGIFVTRRSSLLTDRTPYLRWSQAWMFRALSALLAVEAAES